MAITTAQQTQILQMIQAMFGAAPGATYLSQFENIVNAGTSVANLAQSLSGAVVFYGKGYSASLTAADFANTFINDLVGNRASTEDKAWATSYIVDKMAAGATQAGIIADLTQALSSVPPANSSWGAAATYYNTGIATKIIDNLAGSSATTAAKTDAVNYIVNQMAAGQNLGNMVEWAITALDGVDHGNTIWGSAATLFDNRIEVSKYFSVDKAHKATDMATLQQSLKAVTTDASSVTSAKAIFDTALTGKIQDGYIAGATVTVHIEGQPDFVTTTDAKGNFTLPPGVFGTITATGGTDLSTGKPFSGELKAPAGSTTINPLTTLQQGFVDKGLTSDNAEAAVAKALGLDASKFDLTTFDPLATALDPNASPEQRTLAAQLQGEAAKIANFLIAAGKTLQGAAGGTDKLDAAAAGEALLSSLVNAITSDSDGIVSFSDKALLESIMNESVTLSGDADLLAASTKIAGLADNFAAASAASADSVDKAFAAGGDITAMIANMAQAQVVAQGDMADKMFAAAESGDFSAVDSGFTGAAFDAAAGKAVIGDLNPDSTADDAAAAASNMEASEVAAPAPAPTFTVTQVAETTIITGTTDADNINFPTALNDSIVTGLAGNDTINTGVGNDIIRPGEGIDTVNTGTGNDIVVVVGQTAAGQYTQSDITNPGGSGIDLSSVMTLADLNGRAISEVVSGESIDGGAGTNRLIIYGNVDLTGVTLTNITQFQVNSTVTISAQQLTALGLTVIFGDGESVLNITNSSADPVTLDLSGMSFTDFHTFNVGSGITVVLDQADVNSLQYLSGEGTLKASTATGTLNLASKYVTLDVQDKDGNADATHGGGTYVAGKLLIGTESAETLTSGASDDRIEGGAGNDVLVGSDGNDVLRGGAGVDSMDGGTGDDTFVIVGDISGGDKVDSAADTAALGFPLTNLNGQNLNEDEDGAAEIIIGDEGDDTLYVYGTADLTNYDITGIEHIEIRSDVTFTVLQLSSIQSLRGDGASIVRINTTAGSTTPEHLDLASLSLSQIGHIAIGDNVTVQTPSVGALGGATLLSGQGSLLAASGTLDLTGISQITTLNVRNADGTLPTGVSRADAVIVSTGNVTTKVGTNGDDIVLGTSNGEILVGGDGADQLIGAGGNDLLYGDSQSIGAFNISRDTPTVVGSSYLEQGLGGNAGFGEGVLVPNDDQSTGAIDITSVFGANGLNFFGRSFTSVYVNNNGNITFAGAASQYTPGVINAGATNPIIAPFWGDVDTRGSAPNTPTPNGNSTGSNRVYYDLDSERGIFTVTWDDVGYYNSSTDKLNAFQLQLIAKGEGNFDIAYRYEDINWTTGSASGGSGGLGGTVARAGYSAGTTEGYYELPQSGNQAQMLALDENGKYVFSVRNGHTHTSSNNDTLIGGAGNDVLIGGNGEHDVAVFSGALNEYDIRPIGNTIEVADHTLLRNGKDTLFSDVEYMKFSDGEVGTASYFHTDISTIRADEIFTNTDRLSVTKTIADVNGRDARLDVDGNGGYYKLFFALSSAAYVHIPALQEFPGMLPPAAVTPNQPAVSFDEKNLDYLIDAGLQPLNASDFSQYGFSQSSNVKFADGYFLSNDTEGLDRASVATVFRSSDALFLTFRGTNIYTDDNGITHYGDGYDDAFDMQGHYDRYSTLFNAIDDYLADNTNGIDTVYVSGHSLGGQMAMMYMDNHQGNKFKAVTFEAANKLHEAGASLVHSVGDQRFVNFEISGDVVPDLGLLTGENNISGNYGKTIHLDYESSPLFASHKMSYIATQFDGIAEVLDGATIGMNERVYVDSTEGNASNGDGLIVTESGSPFVPLSVVAGLAQVYFPVATNLVNGALNGVISNVTSDNATSLSDAITFIAREDNAEYQSTGYNLQTAWGHGENYDGGTLVITPINAGQYNLPQSGVGALVVDNTFISENVDVNAAASDHGVIVIGNDGDNKLVGSAHNDVLIGGGNRPLGKGDLLIGGAGDDFLYGGNFSQQVKLDAPLSDYPLSSKGSAALSGYSAGDVFDDVSFLVGGYGKDSMYGSGDNDYFFIDVNLSGNNAANVDQIHDLYVAGGNSFADDWLVFSAQQLGLTTGYMKDTLGWDEISVDIFGHTDTAYNLDFDGGGVAGIATEYWIKVDGIQNYSVESIFGIDSIPAFILDTSVGNLYYDVDGDRDVGDEVLVANIAASTALGADVLTDMHANQILVIPSFDLWA